MHSCTRFGKNIYLLLPQFKTKLLFVQMKKEVGNCRQEVDNPNSLARKINMVIPRIKVFFVNIERLHREYLKGSAYCYICVYVY